jgi:hypothetical protein
MDSHSRAEAQVGKQLVAFMCRPDFLLGRGRDGGVRNRAEMLPISYWHLPDEKLKQSIVSLLTHANPVVAW